MSDNDQVTPTIKINKGDVRRFFVFKGTNDTLISKLESGMNVLFNRDNPIYNDIVPGCVVEAKTIYIAQTYIIVDPVSPPEMGVDAIVEGLDQISQSVGVEIPVLAAGLKEVIELLEDLLERLPKKK